MISKELIVSNSLGLHIRAVSEFSKLACRFQCDITVHTEHKKVNGKSVLGLLSLGAKKGIPITISTDGIDQKEALDALTHLVNSRFGEE